MLVAEGGRNFSYDGSEHSELEWLDLNNILIPDLREAIQPANINQQFFRLWKRKLGSRTQSWGTVRALPKQKNLSLDGLWVTNLATRLAFYAEFWQDSLICAWLNFLTRVILTDLLMLPWSDLCCRFANNPSGMTFRCQNFATMESISWVEMWTTDTCASNILKPCRLGVFATQFLFASPENGVG